MRFVLSWAVAAAMLSAIPLSVRAEGPATVYDDSATLVRVKQQLAGGKGPQEALASLKAAADRELDFAPVSVMDKSEAGPSKDKHDYVSYAPYFWPNPDTKNGLPFIRKDGYRNTEQTSKGDATHYEPMLAAIHTLGLAYWYTGDKQYAEHAAKIARTWFIDPATRMNPNFQYAQAVRGVNDGRGTGLIENRGLVPALDGLALISHSDAWSAADQKAMHEWVAAFDKWMTTSEEGLAEKAAKNNHGSWYAVQESGLYVWLGETDKAREVFEGAKDRISKQIEPNGREPLEVVRTDGFGYSVFNVQALSTLAGMAKRDDVDLWNFEQEGRGLKGAIDHLLPFASGEEKWTENQHKSITAGGMIPVAIAASVAYHDPKYGAWLEEEKDAAAANWTLLTGIVTSGGEPRNSGDERRRRHRDPETKPADTEPDRPPE